jgi:hypothetical protein
VFKDDPIETIDPKYYGNTKLTIPTDTFEAIQEENEFAKLYPFNDMTNRLAIAIIVASAEFYDDPITGLLIFLFLQIVHISVMLLVNPYNQKHLNNFAISTEVFVLFYACK